MLYLLSYDGACSVSRIRTGDIRVACRARAVGWAKSGLREPFLARPRTGYGEKAVLDSPRPFHAAKAWIR